MISFAAPVAASALSNGIRQRPEIVHLAPDFLGPDSCGMREQWEDRIRVAGLLALPETAEAVELRSDMVT